MKPSPSSNIFVWRLLLAAALLALYSISLGHNFLFDEENVILRNPYLGNFANIPQLFTHGFFYLGGSAQSPFLEYYRPLSVLTFMADYHLWKADPLGYNVTSLLFHLSLSLAFFEFLRVYLKDPRASFFAALLYAVHPIHTEALGHVSCRSETLGALFLVLTVLFYLRRRVVPAMVFQTLGFLSKESAVLIPFFLLAADAHFSPGPWRARIKRLAPFFLLSAAYVFYRKFGCPVKMELPVETLREVFLRVLSMGPALAKYFQTLFWPPSFQLFGSVETAGKFTDPKVTVTAGLAILVIYEFVEAWRRKADARLAAAFLWLGFVPYLQWVHFYPEWAEHFLTVPALGLAMLAGLFLNAALNLSGKRRILCLAFFALYAAFLGARTFERNSLYNDPDRYYRTLSESASPYAVHGAHELAKLRLADKKFAEAKGILEEALRRRVNEDISHSLLGWCEMNLGNFEAALGHFRKAAALNPLFPQYERETASALARLGRQDEAAAVYEKMLAKNPADIPLYRLLVNTKVLAGKPEEARHWGERGLKEAHGRKFESAAIAVALLELSIRQGRRDEFENSLKEYRASYDGVPWYGEVLKLFTGETPGSVFLERAKKDFPGFEEEAQAYVRDAEAARRLAP